MTEYRSSVVNTLTKKIAASGADNC